jgi:hypothetical protein
MMGLSLRQTASEHSLDVDDVGAHHTSQFGFLNQQKSSERNSSVCCKIIKRPAKTYPTLSWHERISPPMFDTCMPVHKAATYPLDMHL